MPSKSSRASGRAFRPGQRGWVRRTIGLRSWPSRVSPWEEQPTPDLLDERGETATDQIAAKRGRAVAAFFSTHFGEHQNESRLFWNLERRRVEAIAGRETAIGSLEKMNCARWINKYIRAVNLRLEAGGVFIGCVEVNEQRRARILRKHASFMGNIYYAIDCLVHRILPKLPLLKKAYFAVAKDCSRSLSTAEMLGRLVSCGFEIVEHREISRLTYFAARKVREAELIRTPTYGPICCLRRVGKGAEPFKVYKLRTMHPYSEFLQEYVYRMNNLDAGGKFRDDFRIPAWGRLMRRCWVDELPMIINVLRGEIKLVGVRPLSLQYFSLYPSELQELRRRHTPGLFPPFYVDLPKELDEIVASELKYLRTYEKAPIRTDLRYLCAGLWNILVKRARSA